MPARPVTIAVTKPANQPRTEAGRDIFAPGSAIMQVVLAPRRVPGSQIRAEASTQRRVLALLRTRRRRSAARRLRWLAPLAGSAPFAVTTAGSRRGPRRERPTSGRTSAGTSGTVICGSFPPIVLARRPGSVRATSECCVMMPTNPAASSYSSSPHSPLAD